MSSLVGGHNSHLHVPPLSLFIFIQEIKSDVVFPFVLFFFFFFHRKKANRYCYSVCSTKREKKEKKEKKIII